MTWSLPSVGTTRRRRVGRCQALELPAGDDVVLHRRLHTSIHASTESGCVISFGCGTQHTASQTGALTCRTRAVACCRRTYAADSCSSSCTAPSRHLTVRTSAGHLRRSVLLSAYVCLRCRDAHARARPDGELVGARFDIRRCELSDGVRDERVDAHASGGGAA